MMVPNAVGFPRLRYVRVPACVTAAACWLLNQEYSDAEVSSTWRDDAGHESSNRPAPCSSLPALEQHTGRHLLGARSCMAASTYHRN